MIFKQITGGTWLQQNHFTQALSRVSLLVSLLACLLLSSLAQAHNKVVVIPLLGDDARPMANVITVAKSNADFTDPIAALASINDARADNPYLLMIGPGVYSLGEALFMQEYVDVIGSGEQVTILSGQVSSAFRGSSALVQLSNYSKLSNLTINNVGNNPFDDNIFATGVMVNEHSRDCKLENVRIHVYGASTNYGVYNSSSNAVMRDLQVEVRPATAGQPSGSINFGIYNISGSDVSLMDIKVRVIGGSFSNMAVYTENAKATITDADLDAEGVQAYGVYSGDNGISIVRHSVVDGDVNSVGNTAAGASYINQSSILRPVLNQGVHRCVATDNGLGTEVNNDCSYFVIVPL